MAKKSEPEHKHPADLPVTETGEDWLGFGQYVEGLTSLIEETQTPFMLGVYGDWGVGKTSLMRLLQQSLEKKKHATVWVNPWKYNQSEEVWKALVRAVYEAVRLHLSLLDFTAEHTVDTLRKGGEKALDLVGRLAKVGEVGRELREILTLDSAYCNTFEQAFEE